MLSGTGLDGVQHWLYYSQRINRNIGGCQLEFLADSPRGPAIAQLPVPISNPGVRWEPLSLKHSSARCTSISVSGRGTNTAGVT